MAQALIHNGDYGDYVSVLTHSGRIYDLYLYTGGGTIFIIRIKLGFRDSKP
jgi:hypothetical protein